ncbi:dTDP-4-dehydrorhamnose 3,5-epimerase [Salinarimonas sp.]|uniref:dTDP-4-dehydrorhamnose 3,5-epimerase n=1 Tax=Salinarimonas sp. TaxID=2766526 RepID=UPI0032D99FE7
MSIEVEALEIDAVKIIRPKIFRDHRGFFSEVYSGPALEEAGIRVQFVQDNHSLSRSPGTLRGLHFQRPPFEQAKLVRVIRGAIFDVAVDLRRGSETYGRHVCATLSADAWTQIFVPAGFAHGFVTLEANTEVVYKVSKPYHPASEDGLLWSDRDLAIEWPLPETTLTLSEKDRVWPGLRQLASPF